MPTISLATSGGISDHLHLEEDLTNQIDGYKLTFTTTQEYIPKSLRVVYSGVYYTLNNDFTEVDEVNQPSTTKFTFINDDPFPPQPDCPLYVIYRRAITP
jgi:hypothetical protein